ncbi:MAG: cytochrome b N-terminal domain-containing protein [Acidobacteria bacterium]|nr:cytochrome b N-terminal domain-containing protein [Acidobacteriota bacterium]
MPLRQSNLWRSIFRHPYDGSRRARYLQTAANVFLHLHPVRISPAAIRFTYTWGLGGLSFLLFILLTVSGVFLMFYYVPDSRRAYDDIKDLGFVVPFGQFLRNLHRWAGHAMVITVWLHMLRVFLTGAYKKPREFNWVLGVSSLVLTLLLSFSGYLLPWDQIAFWAITVGTNMATATPVLGNSLQVLILGGPRVGQNALLRFYVLHCLALPLILAIILGVHFWRVRKDGFSASSPGEKIDVWPHLVSREFLAALNALLALVVWSMLVNAPLERLADPTSTPNPAKAPWYFSGLQEMLVYFDPWIAGVLLPLLIIFGLMAIPYLDANPHGVGLYSFATRRWAVSGFVFGFLLWVLLIVIGQFFRGPGWMWYWPWESRAVAKPLTAKTWNFPLPVGAAFVGAYYSLGLYLPRRLRPEVFGALPRGKYCALWFLTLTMLALPIKMLLRLFFRVHYVLATPWFRV